MIRAHRIRLNPTQEQTSYFFKASGTARYAYNWAVDRWQKAEDKKPTAMQLSKMFNAQKPTWAYEVTKCAAAGAFFDFADALRNMRAGRAGAPKFKSRRSGVFSFSLENDKFDVSGHYIKVPKLGLVNMAQKLRFEGKIMNATISKDADWWYASITVEIPDVPALPHPNTVGIDVGILHLATLSDGTIFENTRPLKKALSRLARLQQIMAKKQIGSNNREKLRRKIARQHKQIRDTRNDLLHKLSRYVADRYGFVAVEDLHVKGMVKNHCLAQALSDSALGRLLGFLKTKVAAQGGRVVEVDRFYPSSKTCSNCRERRTDLVLGDRIFKCSNCGLEIDRDLNAAINILHEGMRLAELDANRDSHL
jgi:putative transposase